MPALEQAAALRPTTPVSLPLYLAGLVVLLCGVLSVTAHLEDADLTAACVVLTLLGFVFSLACRRLEIAPWLVQCAAGLVVVLIVARVATGRLDLDWMFGGAVDADTRLAAGLMWWTVLWSWTLVNDETVLVGCVLTAATIGLMGSLNVNAETLTYFCVFVVAMMFLLIHHNFLRLTRGAQSDTAIQAPQAALSIQLGLTAAFAAVVLVIGMLVVVPAQAVFANLSLAQAIRHFVGNGGASIGNGSGMDQFADSARLDVGNGSGWPTGSDVLMRVTPSDGQPHYWRGRTFDLYLGTGWQSTKGMPTPLVARDESVAGRLYVIDTPIPGEEPTTPRTPGMQPLIATFQVSGETQDFYYADKPKTLLYDPDPGAEPAQAMDGHISLLGHLVRPIYSISSTTPPTWDDPKVQERLRHDGSDYAALIRALYLDLSTSAVTRPRDITDFRQAVADATRDLPPNRRTPFDKAVAIRDWISRRCVYSLAIPPPVPDADRVRQFLFSTRLGYCDLFASAMVVLCRTAGIPARVATGFGPGDRDGQSYNLRAMDKHAWAEVYFPGDGWQIFDATVGTKTDGTLPTRPSASLTFFRQLHNLFAASGTIPYVLVGMIVLLLGGVLKNELYDSRRIRRPAAGTGGARADSRSIAQNGRQYDTVMRRLSRLGLPRAPSETPIEYQARALPALTALQDTLRYPLHPELLTRVTDEFLRGRYGAEPAPPDPALAREVTDWTRTLTLARRRQFWRRLLRVRGVQKETYGARL